MRPIKGNESGNSTCCNHPSQSQAHHLSLAGGHPAQPSASQTSTPHPFRYRHQPLCLGMTPSRRVRREDHLKNSGVFLPTRGSNPLWDEVEKFFWIAQDVGCLGEAAETGKGKDQGSLAWSNHWKTNGDRDERDQSHVNMELICVLAWPCL